MLIVIFPVGNLVVFIILVIINFVVITTGNYFQVIFPTTSGEPCETTLHCLVELGIGKKYNSSVR